MGSDSAIDLRDVTKRFGRHLVLDRISLQVPPGVVMALLGENGVGKTTTIQILLGLLNADRGTAHVLGMDCAREGLAIRRRVGYVAERPALDEWMTVEQLGWFAAGFHGPGYQARFEARVAAFAVPLGQRMRQLSKGTRSKVALSLALASDPELLILDEPTSGLDIAVRREVLESMVELAADGRTVLLSSHQIHEVERVADWVAILSHGRIAACARLDDLKERTWNVKCTFTHETASFVWPACVIHGVRRGRQSEMVVEGSAESVEAMRANWPGVEHWETQHPSLEEIYLAYQQQAANRSSADHDTSASVCSVA